MSRAKRRKDKDGRQRDSRARERMKRLWLEGIHVGAKIILSMTMLEGRAGG
jgi:hypothetical protein